VIKPIRSIAPLAIVFACIPTLVGCGSESDAPADAAIMEVANKAGDESISFNRDIRPILSENCFFCHGPDSKHQEADLRLDFFEYATLKKDGYAAIVPGNKEDSETWIRINDQADPMPPKKSHKKLSKEEIELIGKWIDQGAEYETHWAYAPVTKPDLPEVKNEAWVANELDRFILAKLEARGIEPSPQADKRTLLRRVTYDLTGLPPTPEQTNAFLNDPSPQAYENYVDSLLAEETYGEHLAVWWLDLVRFADSIGFHSDNPMPVWPYRDWVIKSFNENLPFDQFTVMQLAGDQMADPPTRDMRIASAYNRLSPMTEEGGAQPKEYRAIQNAERVSNYGDVWLGSSTACAQCHDHKFDPISTEDFYTLAAFFGSLNGANVSWEKYYARHRPPVVFAPQNDEQLQLIKEHEAKYDAFINEHPAAIRVEDHHANRDPRPPLPSEEEISLEDRKAFMAIIKERENLIKQVPIVMTSRDLDVPRTVRILPRGNWLDETGPVVQPATPAFLGGPRSTEDNRLTRLDLAKWTVSPDNPLTARVFVNRLWGRYLGTAISSNTIELGSQGSPPTHPELLDWMASEFVASGWNMKQMIKQIVNSSTYKQSADAREDLAVIDPNNTKLFARQSAVRLPAEAIRDQVLAVSGLLKPRLGGPSVFPYQPDGHWEPLNFPRRSYPTSKGDDLYRRSMYTWVQRTFPHPMMVNFDSSSREMCTGQRMVSNTPLQALTTLNGPVFVEAARTLAAQLITANEADEQRLDALYQLVLARSPRDSERDAIATLLDSQRKHFAQSPEDAKKLIAVGESPSVDKLDPAELAAWTSACRVVLNLHESMTRN
jgi:mono/diheme cytochrome c family protein